jgi:alpha-mannosidase
MALRNKGAWPDMKKSFQLCALLSALLCVFLCAGYGQAQTWPNRQDVKYKLDLLQGLTRLPDEGWKFHPGDDLPNGEDPRLDDSGWQPVKDGFSWNTGTGWFRRTITVPADLNGYDITGSDWFFQFRVDSEDFTQQIIYYNGSRVAMGEDLEPVELVRNAQPGRTVVIAVKAVTPPVKTNFRGTVIRIQTPPSRPDPAVLRSELLAADALLEAEHGDMQPLEAALAAIDPGTLMSKNQLKFDASLQAAQSALGPLDEPFSKKSIRVTGNSHIDMAWLWPWSETVNVVRDTFRTSIQLMNEYPEYTFTQSTAQASAWLEEKYPELFEEIKKRVQEGRWELVGGMWVEPDLNMPDGESQVRQLLIGKRYFKEKFGKDVRIGWNPDSFGYNWQLPQIYKKSGIDYFVTQKIDWNDTNKPKDRLFWWQSPDGSKVLTYFPHDYVNDTDPVKMAKDFALNSSRLKNFDELMHLYGIGDHGGGPTRVMIENGKRWEDPKLVYPRVFFGTAQGFFDHVEKNAAAMQLPTVNDELYFEYHRGVFTSQAETKKGNRRSEQMLLDAEKFGSMAHMVDATYRPANLTYAWKKTLFNQFHDIAAGSGISALYADAARDYAEVKNIAAKSLDDSFTTLAAHANTQGTGVPVMVFNALSWDRDDVAEADVQLPAAPAGKISVLDSNGSAVPSQVVWEDHATHRYKVQFLAHVPSMGYKTFRVTAAAAKPAHTALSVSGWHIENAFLALDIDPETGCITSLKEKKSGSEVIAKGGCGNLLQAFRDKPKDWDAWNIDADFEAQKWDLTEAKSVTFRERGPLRAVVRIVRTFQNSTFTQDVTVYDGVARVDILTDADWHEKHILIKAAVPLTVDSPSATYEIPFGSIARPTTRNNSIEKAKFEVPALRWADLSDSNHGLSLLNDCKYGYDGKGNVLRISLLRSPEWPDPHADEGRHTFTYSLYPHAGDWKQADTVRRGYELNHQLYARQVEKHDGKMPAQYSFVQVGSRNVVLTAMKPSDDGEKLVLRFFEWAGQPTPVRLKVASAVASAEETNLMEQPQAKLALQDGEITIKTGAFEIKTLNVALANPPK